MTLEEIYTKHKTLVYNLALHYTQNVQDAEEVTQDVFLKVYLKLNSFKKQSNLQTWIYRITINKSLDFIKAKKSKKRTSQYSTLSIDKEDNHIPIVEKNHPGVLMENKEATDAIFNCINLLPDKQKTTIILLKIEQLSIKETAFVMNLSYKAIESLYQRAKNNLKVMIDKTKEYG